MKLSELKTRMVACHCGKRMHPDRAAWLFGLPYCVEHYPPFRDGREKK